MNIYIGQIYIDVGVKFEFNHVFQEYIHSILTRHSTPPNNFLERYKNYDFMFRMSAKKDIQDVEIKGPSIFKRDKDIEYSIFLPYDVITQKDNHNYWALKYLFRGIYEIYDKNKFEYDILEKKEEEIIKKVISDSSMFYKE